jgi:hypothetical protein
MYLIKNEAKYKNLKFLLTENKFAAGIPFPLR